MRTIQFLAWSMVLLLSLATSAWASIIERNLNVHLDESLITVGQDNLGNVGKNLRFDIFFDPFTFGDGDTINTHITFDRILTITDTGNGFWGSPNYYDGLELMRGIYWYSSDPQGGGSASMVSTTTLRVVAGDPELQSAYGSSNSGGGGISVQSLFVNWTDSAISISGMDISTRIYNYNLVSGDGTFAYYSGLMSAGDFAISEIPEPTSLAIVGLSLAGLALSRRRRHE